MKELLILCIAVTFIPETCHPVTHWMRSSDGDIKPVTDSYFVLTDGGSDLNSFIAQIDLFKDVKDFNRDLVNHRSEIEKDPSFKTTQNQNHTLIRNEHYQNYDSCKRAKYPIEKQNFHIPLALSHYIPLHSMQASGLVPVYLTDAKGERTRVPNSKDDDFLEPYCEVFTGFKNREEMKKFKMPDRFQFRVVHDDVTDYMTVIKKHWVDFYIRNSVVIVNLIIVFCFIDLTLMSVKPGLAFTSVWLKVNIPILLTGLLVDITMMAKPLLVTFAVVFSRMVSAILAISCAIMYWTGVRMRIGCGCRISKWKLSWRRLSGADWATTQMGTAQVIFSCRKVYQAYYTSKYYMKNSKIRVLLLSVLLFKKY